MIETPNPMKLMTVADLAKLFGKSERTIQRWVRRKWLPTPVRPGGPDSTPYWRAKDMDDYFAAGSIGAYRRSRRHQ